MCKVLGLGLDLCAISRMEREVSNAPFLHRCFTPQEQAYLHQRGLMASASMAAMWAAKEAVGKALGTGITFPLTDVEILHDAQGAPQCVLHGQALALSKGGHMMLSITHEGDTAAAVCLWMDAPAGVGAP